MLTSAQKRQFVEEGYLIIPNAVSQVLINAALRAVNHSIGHVGLGGEDMAHNRSAFFCSELLDAPVILDLFAKSPVMAIAESLMGEGNVLPVQRAKPYPRFPLPVGEDAPAPRGHLDGIGNGSNGMAKGEHRRGFTAFAVIFWPIYPSPIAETLRSGPNRTAPLPTIFSVKGTRYGRASRRLICPRVHSWSRPTPAT